VICVTVEFRPQIQGISDVCALDQGRVFESACHPE
jgi:hypothetical protein